jgi:iron complex outermembrane receptor protein
VRANLDNVLDKSYWDANSFGQLTVSEPRTFLLSATFDF